MRPLKLSMKGFGAFREQTDIDLTDIDLVALVGATGSGKSTIIDAITFALYGTVARYENNRLVAPVINQTSTEAQVALEFELDHQTYTAVRVVRRTGDSRATTREARLERGEDILAADASAMSIKVEGLIGLDVEQFNRTVVLPQGKFADFLHDKPGNRQDTLRQLLGLQMFRRIGQQARQRSEKARNQVAALQPEHDSKAEELTDEHRERLQNRIRDFDKELIHIKCDRATIDELADTLAGLKDQIELLDEKITGMSKIAIPGDLQALAGQISEARHAETQAKALRGEWTAARRLAYQAVADGPDLRSVEEQLKKHHELIELTGRHDTLIKTRQEANLRYQSAADEAGRMEKAQKRLDDKIQETRNLAGRARARREDAVTTIQIDTWEAAYHRYREAVEKAEDAERQVQSAQEALPALREALESATVADQEASARLEEAHKLAGVLGHLDLLAVDQDCPLCLQPVTELPVHTFDDGDLHQAKAEKQLTQAARAKAQQIYETATAELKGKQASASSAIAAAKHHQTEIAAAPPRQQLNKLRQQAIAITEEVRKAEEAVGEAEAEAREHRDSPIYAQAIQARQAGSEDVTRLNVEADLLSGNLASLRDEVAKFPSQKELRRRMAEANGLQAALGEADQQLQNAEAQHEKAAGRLAEADAQHKQATDLLIRTRDSIAKFEPPPMGRSGLVAEWSTLTDWAAKEKQAAKTEREGAIEKQTRSELSRDKRLGNLRSRFDQLLGGADSGATVGDLEIRLREQLAVTQTNLKQFDKDRKTLQKLEAQIDNLTEDARVARKLGHLLRADGFESWLMEAALDRLVERATERLYELSNGQYSLEIHDRDFYVRDHTNADELRRARTLSGGETFLASLSLSLALAQTTSDLSTGVMPAMESIFLDEGFGTLDPHTLETVATAVEELGAEGKLVGIVTHIRELADRMPVRLELTKTGGTARVARVEN